MKAFRDAIGRFKSVKINLLDGQKKGEIIFRRIFFVAAIYGVIALLGMLFIDKPKYEEYIKEVNEIEAFEVIEEKEEWVDGDRVTEKVDGSFEVVPAEVFRSQSLQNIEDFVLKEYPGSRIDRDYLNKLELYCSEDTLRVVIGISVAETSMGRNTNRDSNFWGYFKGGNRQYDPSREEMAKVICEGIAKSYMNIGKNNRVTSIYTGNDSPITWTKNFNWAISQM